MTTQHGSEARKVQVVSDLGCGCPLWANPFNGKVENFHNELCLEKWALRMNAEVYKSMSTAERFSAFYAILTEFAKAWHVEHGGIHDTR